MVKIIILRHASWTVMTGGESWKISSNVWVIVLPAIFLCSQTCSIHVNSMLAWQYYQVHSQHTHRPRPHPDISDCVRMQPPDSTRCHTIAQIYHHRYCVSSKFLLCPFHDLQFFPVWKASGPPPSFSALPRIKEHYPYLDHILFSIPDRLPWTCTEQVSFLKRTGVPQNFLTHE